MWSYHRFTEIVKHYSKGKLPENIKIFAVKYRKGIEGEIILLSSVPEWIQPPQRKGLFPNCSKEQITLEEITVDNQVIVAGYGPIFKILMIGQSEFE